MLKKLVYLETSFVSYLVARPSKNLVIAFHQSITQDWWKYRATHSEVVISGIVVEEAK